MDNIFLDGSGITDVHYVGALNNKKIECKQPIY